ncbi:hypothetical protein WA026_009881 [Henosepilachna vigintioctopunctata]|uniref:Uncharacterized protein n=1 Tax=Henosepilachna vigintioctopunctata TaxID=420089 RepID=A0AAW1TKE9_9CUCU
MKLTSVFSCFCVVINFVFPIQCYKILGLLPYTGKSHMDVILPFMKELSKRGHEVTVLSHYPSQKPLPRYRDLSLKGTSPLLLEVEPANNLNKVVSRLVYSYFDVVDMGFIADQYCEAAFRSRVVRDLLKSNETFDLIIHEPFTSDCMLALNEKFKSPVIGITTSVMLAWNNERFGNPDNPSYIPTYFMDFSDRMSFFSEGRKHCS